MAFQTLCIRAENYLWNLISNTLSLLHTGRPHQAGFLRCALPSVFPPPGNTLPLDLSWLHVHISYPMWHAPEWPSLCFSNSSQVYLITAFHSFLFWTVFLHCFIVCLLQINIDVKKSCLSSLTQYPENLTHNKSKTFIFSEWHFKSFLLHESVFLDLTVLFLPLISNKSCTFFKIIMWNTLHIYFNMYNNSGNY